MTGGGDRPIRGKMSSRLQTDVSPQELASMESELQRQESSVKVRLASATSAVHTASKKETVHKSTTCFAFINGCS